MGVVLAAVDPVLDRQVAIKLLREELAGSAGGAARMRLLREAQAMARLDHPNVVAVHDAGEDGDQVFIAMEFVDGVTLRTWLHEEPRDWRHALDAWLHAGRGLHAAHEAGLVHRDFKPDNVLVSRDGRVRVTDFGLVRSGEDGVRGAAVDAAGSTTVLATAAGALVGTPRYMAPEQARGERADARSDQFSFAVSVYESLYGVHPFAGDSMGVLLAAAEAGMLTPPPTNTKVPRRVKTVLERALAAKPGDRFESMGALLKALEQSAHPARRGVLALGGASLLLLGGLGFGLWPVLDPTPLGCADGARCAANERCDVWARDGELSGRCVRQDSKPELCPKLEGEGGRMTTRLDHQAVKLPCGRVLVVGGTSRSRKTMLPVAQVFDPQTSRWYDAGALKQGRRDFALASLPDGRVVVGGGESLDRRLIKSIEVFDGTRFTELARPLHLARQRHALAVVGSEGVLAAGGYAGLVTEWLTGARTFPGGNMLEKRERSGWTVLSDGALLFAGGSASVAKGPWLASAELFRDGKWQAAGALSVARDRLVLAALPGGQALAVGGTVGFKDPVDTLDLFANGAWTTAGKLSKPRHTPGVAVLRDGRVMIAGGHDGTGAVTDVDLWSPPGVVTPGPPMLQPRAEFSLTTLDDGTVLAAGYDDAVPAERYGPLADGTWGWTPASP